MRTSTKLMGAAAASAALLAGGSAFTASNTVAAIGISGYGQTVATGATITAVTDTLLGSDNSKLASVVFASSTDVTTKVASMTLKNGVAVVGSPYTCTLGAYAAGTMDITCLTADNPLLSAFDTTGLTVT